MKYLLLSLLMATFLFSCQDDEDLSRAEPFDVTFADVPPTLLPLAIGNYWVYEVHKVDTLGNEELQTSNDTIKITGDTIINNESYYTMEDNTFVLGRRTIYVRESSGSLLTSRGEILLSNVDFDRIIYTFEGGPAKFEYTMQSEIQTKSVPLGVFECLNYEGIATNTSDPDLPLRKIFNLYSENVGLVSSNGFFFNSFNYSYERRLVDFHLE